MLGVRSIDYFIVHFPSINLLLNTTSCGNTIMWRIATLLESCITSIFRGSITEHYLQLCLLYHSSQILLYLNTWHCLKMVCSFIIFIIISLLNGWHLLTFKIFGANLNLQIFKKGPLFGNKMWFQLSATILCKIVCGILNWFVLICKYTNLLFNKLCHDRQFNCWNVLKTKVSSVLKRFQNATLWVFRLLSESETKNGKPKWNEEGLDASWCSEINWV